MEKFSSKKSKYSMADICLSLLLIQRTNDGQGEDGL